MLLLLTLITVNETKGRFVCLLEIILQIIENTLFSSEYSVPQSLDCKLLKLIIFYLTDKEA